MTNIRDEIAALQVRVPTASRYQHQTAEEETKRKYKRRQPQADLDAQRKEIVFGLIVEAAVRGWRCPTSQDVADQHNITNSSRLFSMLAADGRIRIEVSARNWRTVWICDGEHRGLHTQRPIWQNKPYMVLGPARP